MKIINIALLKAKFYLILKNQDLNQSRIMFLLIVAKSNHI